MAKRDDFPFFVLQGLQIVILSLAELTNYSLHMEEVFCPVCAEGYYCARPRVLPCGHSLCENCLKLTLEKLQFNCFYCKRSMVQDGKISCPVNYGLESLVKKMIKTEEGLLFNQEQFRELTQSYRDRIVEQMKER